VTQRPAGAAILSARDLNRTALTRQELRIAAKSPSRNHNGLQARSRSEGDASDGGDKGGGDHAGRGASAGGGGPSGGEDAEGQGQAGGPGPPVAPAWVVRCWTMARGRCGRGDGLLVG